VLNSEAFEQGDAVDAVDAADAADAACAGLEAALRRLPPSVGPVAAARLARGTC